MVDSEKELERLEAEGKEASKESYTVQDNMSRAKTPERKEELKKEWLKLKKEKVARESRGDAIDTLIYEEREKYRERANAELDKLEMVGKVSPEVYSSVWEKHEASKRTQFSEAEVKAETRKWIAKAVSGEHKKQKEFTQIMTLRDKYSSRGNPPEGYVLEPYSNGYRVISPAGKVVLSYIQLRDDALRFAKEHSGLPPDRKPRTEAEKVSDLEELLGIHAKRSPRAQSSDERLLHSIVVSPYSPKVKYWKKRPGSMDVRGVDTPTRRKKSKVRQRPTPVAMITTTRR